VNTGVKDINPSRKKSIDNLVKDLKKISRLDLSEYTTNNNCITSAINLICLQAMENTALAQSIQTLTAENQELKERVTDTENALTGAISCIDSMKCCGNCGSDTKKAIQEPCYSCIRQNYYNFAEKTDNWQPKDK